MIKNIATQAMVNAALDNNNNKYMHSVIVQVRNAYSAGSSPPYAGVIFSINIINNLSTPFADFESFLAYMQSVAPVEIPATGGAFYGKTYGTLYSMYFGSSYIKCSIVDYGTIENGGGVIQSNVVQLNYNVLDNSEAQAFDDYVTSL